MRATTASTVSLREVGRRPAWNFSEEKNQKTFMSGVRGNIPAMASIVGVAEK